MNWYELLIYVKTRKVEYVDNARIPPRKEIIDGLDSYDVGIIRRLSE